MLGKGLESLIPPQGGAAGPSGNNSPASAGNIPASVPAAPDPREKNIAAGPTISSAPSPAPAIPAPREAAPAAAQAPAPVVAPTAMSPGESPPAPVRAEAHVHQPVFQIEVEKISPNPHQPRKHFDDAALRELAASIREFGILQPLVVTKIEEEGPAGLTVRYELIAGERRLLAAKLLGLPRVPAIVREVDAARERLELAVIENIQRENLNPIEMGRAFARLQDEFRLTQREIATRLGKSREVVANTLRLLDLPTYIQDAVGRGDISESHGRLLLTVGDPDAQKKLFEDLVGRHMTTRELRARVQAAKPVPKEPSPRPELLALEEKLSAELGAPVKIAGGEAGGKITIIFYSPEELKHILARFGGEGNEGV